MLRFFRQAKQIEELRQELDKQRRIVSGLELEWSDMHDRLRRMLAKISKRDERARAAEDAHDAGGEEAAGNSPEQPTSLSARQQELNARILQRRSRNLVPNKGGE